MKTMVEKLAQYIVGWRGYFGFCETPTVLRGLDSWVRRRVRSAFWRQWKTSRKRTRELVRRGVNRKLAVQTAGSRKGSWRVSHSPGLAIALPDKVLAALGVPTLIVS